MASLWRLSLMSISKQSHYGITALSSRNSLLPNIIQRSYLGPRGALTAISPRSTQKFQDLDGVSKECLLIYKSSVANLVKYCYYVSIVFCVSSMIALFYAYKNYDATVSLQLPPSESVVDWMSTDQNVSLTMLACLLASNFALTLWSRKHVIRIWYHPRQNKYIFRQYSIFRRPDSVIFAPGTVKLKRKNPQTAFGRSAHIINGKTYYFNEMNFRTPADYEKVLGRVALE